MRVTSTKQIIIILFIFIYIPFLWDFGYKLLFTSHGDFAGFYWGAKLAFVEHHSPYAADAFAGVDPINRHEALPYLYPPPSLLVFYPLTLFRYGVAHALMLMMNHTCILLFIYLFFFKIMRLNLSQPFDSLIAVLSIVYLFTNYPLTRELLHGQIDLVVLLCLCLTWYAMKQNARSWLVALPLSVAILIKTYPVLFILLLIINKKYRAFLWVVGLLLLYTSIAYLVLPHVLWTEWVTNVLPTGGYGQVPYKLVSPAYTWNQNINGFVSRIFLKNEFSEALWPNPAIARTLPYLLSLCVVATTVGVSYLASRRQDAGRVIDLEFALFLPMVFIVAPLSWEQHLVYMLPSAFKAFYLLLDNRRNYISKIIVMLVLFGLARYIPIESSYLKRGVLTLGISIKLYAVVILWIYFVLQIHRFARGTQPAAQAQATPELLHAS